MSPPEPVRSVDDRPAPARGKSIAVGVVVIVAGLFLVTACQGHHPHKKKGHHKGVFHELHLPKLPLPKLPSLGLNG